MPSAIAGLTLRYPTRIIATLALVIIATLMGQTNALAQIGNPPQTSPEATRAMPDPASWSRILDNRQKAIARERISANELETILQEARRIRDAALLEIQRLQPQMDQARQQLDGLGKPPAEGEPAETEEVQVRRQELSDAFAAVDTQMKQARLALLRAEQLQASIASLRQSRLVRALLERTPEVYSREFLPGVTSGFSSFFRQLNVLFNDSFAVFGQRVNEAMWKLLALPLLLAGILYALFRAQRFLLNYRMRLEGKEAPPTVTAFFTYLQKGVLLAILPYVIYSVFSSLDVLSPRLNNLAADLCTGLGLLIASVQLFKVFLGPNHPNRRLIDLSDGPASSMYRVLVTGLTTAAILFVLDRIAVSLFAPVEVVIVLGALFNFAVGGTFLIVMSTARKDRRARDALYGTASTSKLWIAFSLSVMFVSAFILFATVLAFVALGVFLSQMVILSTAVLLTAYLVLRQIDYRTSQIAARSVESATGEDGLDPHSKAHRNAILLNGLGKLITYVVAILLLLGPLGYRSTDLQALVTRAFFGFEVGGLSISLSTVFLAIGLFFLGYTVTVAIRSWLNNRFLPTTRLDIGIANSISTVFGYIGFILAAILAVSAAGFDMSNLAIVAGALSVGVGFGLQSIVNNFVSGLILLAERPIKAGDWISAGGSEGTVKRISVRSTEIETFDRATVIVPNSNLITDTVTNWTHGNKTGRIIIDIGVAYDSDPRQVEEILLGCAKAHRMVLGKPPPICMFMDFGPDALNFSLRCFLADINYMLSVKSELRFQILDELRKANIAIPFPQREIHIRTDDTLSSKGSDQSDEDRRKKIIKAAGSAA